jgi:branched-chain amino acid aminotransferase
MGEAAGSLKPLNASNLEVTWTTDPKAVPAHGSQLQPEVTTDHMITVSWTHQEGWETPRMVPYGPLSFMPSSSVLNYASTCFDGFKLYRGYDGRLRMLQPEYNCRRMLQSAVRITLPEFDPQELLKLTRELCIAEAPKWLPTDMAGTSLYIRPVMMGCDTTLGYRPARSALLCIFLVYWPGPKVVAPVLADAGAPVSEQGSRLLASTEREARAFPGGSGAAKIGANYAPTLLPHANAVKKGYDQVLWLFGPDRYVTEAGGSNFFLIWRTDAGSLELVTAPLDDDGLILAGSTRAFVLGLARTMFKHEQEDGTGPCEVVERRFTMGEVEAAANEGRLESAFVTGTAWQIHPVGVIGSKGRDIKVPVGKLPHMSLLREKMLSIVYGKEENDWVQVVEQTS